MSTSTGEQQGETLLRDPQFLRYLLGRILSGAGNVATLIALPVLVYRASDSASLTALVAACEAAPYLLFGLLAGALTDRWNRKKVMIGADVASTLLLLTIPLAHALGEVTVPHVLLVAFLGPTIGVFFDGAVFGAVPMLVGRHRIAAANSYVWSASSVIEIAVPALAGVLLAFIHPAWLLGFDAATFALSGVLLLGIHRPLHDASRARNALTLRQVGTDIREGIGWLVRHPGVRTMTVVSFLQCLGGGAFMALYVVWADRILHIGTEGWRFGTVYGVWAVGSLIASLWLPRLVQTVSPARIALVALPVNAALWFVVTLQDTWWVAGLLMVPWSVAYTMVAINAITYRQQVTPEHLLGRVNTAGRMLSWGLGWTGGAFLAGGTVHLLGLRPALLVFACASVAAVVVAWTSPLRTGQYDPGTD